VDNPSMEGAPYHARVDHRGGYTAETVERLANSIIRARRSAGIEPSALTNR